jgi:MFS family permease
VTFGFCAAFWIAYATFKLNSNLTWRIPVGLQLVAGVIMILGLYFIPESPRWLIYRDRNKEALEILAKLRSRGDISNVEVQMEFTGIVQDVTFDKMAYQQRFLSLLRKGNDNNRRRTLLGMGMHICTQLSGINALL